MKKNSESSFLAAHSALQRYLIEGGKADSYFESASRYLSGEDRRRAQHLYAIAIRHLLRLQAALNKPAQRPPRPTVSALCMLAGAELITADERSIPQIVHYFVHRAREVASPAEAKFVNAVLRRFPEQLAAPVPLETRYSVPSWLLTHWQSLWSTADLAAWLDWIDQPPPLYVSFLEEPNRLPTAALEATPWPSYWKVRSGHWADIASYLDAGMALIQDPLAQHAQQLLKPLPQETIADFCAAPGGKSQQIQNCLGPGQLVSVDLPQRMPLLENACRTCLQRRPKMRWSTLAADILHLTPEKLEQHQLPSQFDAILLDAPCSNTGVIRRRPDVKYRLEPDSFQRAADLQFALLKRASHFVRRGGRLVYSTCSIEPIENQDVIQRFLTDHPTWHCAESIHSLPWKTGHDGGSAFLLRHSS